MCFRRQFQRKMWPIQLAFLRLIVHRIFLPSSILCNIFFTWSTLLTFSILLQHLISKLPRYFSSTFGYQMVYKILIIKHEGNIQNTRVHGRKVLHYRTHEICITPWHAKADREGPRRYRSNTFAFSALERMGWSTPSPTTMSPGNTRYPL